MREEREGEEEVDFEELRLLMLGLEIIIRQSNRRWREQKRKWLMMEKSEEYFEEHGLELKAILEKLEDILEELEKLEDILEDVLQFIRRHIPDVRCKIPIPIFPFTEHTREEVEELHQLEDILQLIRIHTEEELHHLMEKLERGEVLNADEVASLMRIEEFARSKGREELLREVERAFTKLGELTNNIAAEPEKMELKKGEIKEIDENTLIRRRKDGKLELILL